MTPKYLELAYAELGVREVPGHPSNPRILQYHQATTLKATDDETAWCSAFVCWCMQQAGIDHTRSARARSWLQWGTPIQFPVVGCIAVLQRGPGNQPPASVIEAPGHVGIFVGFADLSRILLLAGNQSNMVSIVSFGINTVLGYRVPSVVQGG
jgi:uncharacterized protein (TIGR02594 family)